MFGRKTKYVELGNRAKGKIINIRPLGNPISFYEGWIKDNKGKNHPIRVEDLASAESHPLALNYGVKFNLRYALNVIDKEDNQIKILCCPKTIFNVFENYFFQSGKNPGDLKNGAEFSIIVNGGKNFYETKFLCLDPLNYNDIENIKSQGGGYNLLKKYANTKTSVWENWISEKEKARNKEEHTELDRVVNELEKMANDNW